jgi:hypothetical protein
MLEDELRLAARVPPGLLAAPEPGDQDLTLPGRGQRPAQCGLEHERELESRPARSVGPVAACRLDAAVVAWHSRVVRARRHQNVDRVDHHYFHGWRVCLKRQGRRLLRYFNDRGGDPRRSLAQALAWRDRMAAQLPPPRKFHRVSSVNKTGVVGVAYSRERARSGRLFRRYGAFWMDEKGRVHKRTFSVAKHGAAKARELAVKARKDALAEMLRPARVPAASRRRAARSHRRRGRTAARSVRR